MNDFKGMQEYVSKMRATSSLLKKKNILREYSNNHFVNKCVLYTLNPYWKYGVTSKQILKFVDAGHGVSGVGEPYECLFELLDDLCSRKITGHCAIRHILAFVDNNVGYSKLIFDILDKDIETRANATLVNLIWGKGFIPQFSVSLARDYEEKLVDWNDTWLASRKLDGLRCICKINSAGEAVFYTKNGHVIHTLNKLAFNVRQSYVTNLVFDGEICIMRGDLEDFKAISSEYKKKNHTIASPRFAVIDVLTHEEFDSGTSTVKLSARLAGITDEQLPDGFKMLKQRVCKSDGEIMVALKQADELGHEGLILRKDCEYKGKRSNDMLKLKMFHEKEYRVIGTVFGKMRFIENGKDVERETLTAVEILHKGSAVFVGSGFSKDEREMYYSCPEEIIGNEITVKYKQESVDSNGKVSLQFPTLKAIHGRARRY
jgi:DNA ligase-1